MEGSKTVFQKSVFLKNEILYMFMIFKVISIKILLFMTILLFFTWTIVLCATSSRRLKADDTNKIAKIKYVKKLKLAQLSSVLAQNVMSLENMLMFIM